MVLVRILDHGRYSSKLMRRDKMEVKYIEIREAIDSVLKERDQLAREWFVATKKDSEFLSTCPFQKWHQLITSWDRDRLCKATCLGLSNLVNFLSGYDETQFFHQFHITAICPCWRIRNLIQIGDYPRKVPSDVDRKYFLIQEMRCLVKEAYGFDPI